MTTDTSTFSARRLSHVLGSVVPPKELSMPPSGSLSAKLWDSSTSLAQDALNTLYIQGIAHGTLDPNNYGQYSVQDAVYCSNAIESYNTAIGKAADGTIRAFLTARRDGYIKYKDNIFSQWHIGQPSAINPSPAPAAKQYMAFESMVALRLPPLYLVIAMIPCERLWSWLANQVKPGPSSGNLYNFWINGNLNDSGAQKLETFINQHVNNIDAKLALGVYQGCMTGEGDFFRSAGGQSPLDRQRPEYLVANARADALSYGLIIHCLGDGNIPNRHAQRLE
jgi:thiaminase/transcriptional activator TenA